MKSLSEADRRAVAGALLHAHLAGRRLPEYLPGEPNRMAAARWAREEAEDFLATLADLYGVQRWSPMKLRRAFVGGALAGWRPGSTVVERRNRVSVISASCPLGAEVERDARVCQACQAFQQNVVRLALGERVADVAFERLISRGDATCQVDVTQKEAA